MRKRIIPFLLILAMLFAIIPGTGNVTAAKKVVKVKQIKLNKKSVTLTEGKSIQLKYTLTPKNTTQKKVSWSTSNKKVAKVSNGGKVTSVKRGTATITVTVNGTNKKARCKVTVVCNHKYKTTTVKSTCVKNGYSLQKCQRCGTSKSAILPLGKHKYNVKTVEATCTKDGYIEKKCTICKKRETEVLESGHNYKETRVKATCTKDGRIRKKCTRCGESTDDVIKATGHCYEYDSLHYTSCDEDIYNKYKCSRCGDIKKEMLEKREHSYYTSSFENPTCSKAGYTEYKCAYCGHTKRTTIEKWNHAYAVSRTEPATCLSAGYKKYKCSECGDEYTETIPKNKHDIDYLETVQATCTTYKYEIYKCRNCDYTEERNWGNKYEHGPSVVVEDHNSTSCTDEHYVIRQCSDCGGKFRKDLTIQEWYHEYELDHYTIQPDCEHTGRAVFKCSLCEKTKEEDVGELHDYEITDSNLQYKWEKCRLCGEEAREFNDKEYVIDIGNGETATVVGHYDLETAEEMVVELNKYRKQKFRFELKRNEKMMEAARIRAAEIEYYFQHDRPNGKKITVGENITGARNASAEYITRNIFANSPDHNANMLIANYRYCGCAIFCVKSKVNGEYGMNVVQMFSDINENSVPSILGE